MSAAASRSRVAIVGGGAAGTLVAAQLRRRRPDARITVIDASGRPATGAAYGTPDPTHLLNVPAERMSAWPDDPEHLCRWLEEHAVATFDGFAPRVAYGRYLRELLTTADVRLEQAEVTRLVHGAPIRLTLSDGRVLAADVVALAAGRPPGTMPDALARALAPVLADGAPCCVVEDPWAPGELARLVATRPERVLVIGSGLTGVDVALHLVARGVEVTLVSRHGALPRAHRAAGAPRPVPAVDRLQDRVHLDAVRAAFQRELADAAEAGDDWRQVVDALRPHTTRLWRSLEWSDQRRFLREDLREWEVLRHRMPPSVAAAIADARRTGRLAVLAGEVAEVRPAGRGLSTTLSSVDGTVRRRDDALVVATGTMWDRRALEGSPLWSSLLEQGLVSVHPSGLGIRTDDAGRPLDASGDVVHRILTIGAIRQGELWETTAIPEIRQHAAAVAELLAATDPLPAPAPRRRRAPRVPVRPAEAAYQEGVRRLLNVQSGASAAFVAAVTEDGGHARAHAALALLATERPGRTRAGGLTEVAEHLERARTAADASGSEDQSHVDALATWCLEGSRVGTASLVAHLEHVPDDALALVVLAPSIAFAGAGDALPDVWGYLDRFGPVHGEVPWFLGLTAYGRTEQLRFFEAGDLAEAALDADPGNGNGAHALSHVHYETDAHGAGLQWLSAWMDDAGRTQRYRPHFQWHAALHELAMGDASAAARRYTTHLAPPRSRGVRCLVDAGSLAWRARLHPDWITPPDPLPILREAADLATDPQTAFIAFHALLVHAANGDVAALEALQVPGLTEEQAATLRSVALGLVALVEERPRAALDHLLEALPGLPAVGGSRVQQEVVLETALAAMLQLGAPGQAARLLSRHRSAPSPGIRRGAVS